MPWPAKYPAKPSSPSNFWSPLLRKIAAISTRPSSKAVSLPTASRAATSIQNPRLLTSDIRLLPILIAGGSSSDMNRAEPLQPSARSQSRHERVFSQMVARPQKEMGAPDHVFGKSGGFSAPDVGTAPGELSGG